MNVDVSALFIASPSQSHEREGSQTPVIGKKLKERITKLFQKITNSSNEAIDMR